MRLHLISLFKSFRGVDWFMRGVKNLWRTDQLRKKKKKKKKFFLLISSKDIFSSVLFICLLLIQRAFWMTPLECWGLLPRLRD